MSQRLPLQLAVPLGVVLAGVYACASSSRPSSGHVAGGAGAGAGGVGGAVTGAAGEGRAGAGGGATIDVRPPQDASPEDLTEDAACGIGTAAATLRPLTLMIMFDRSGRMINSGSVDPVTMLNRWQTATAALTSFFQDANAAGLAVALRFFPDNYPAGQCTNAACDVNACSQVLVDAATLTAAPAPEDEQEAALLDAIAVSTPASDGALGGGEPIHAALEGALAWATTYQASHEAQRTVVVLVTNGDPLGCDEDFGDISSLASDALATGGVSTYALGLADSMGVGANTELMNEIAKAGGTDQAFFINDGQKAAAALVDALGSIRGMALPCDFPLPEATSNGNPVDRNLVNVTLTAGDGTESTFTKVEDAAQCGAASSWYYDEEAAPPRIDLCPSACGLAQGTENAKLEVLAGCKPKLEVLR